MGFSSHFSLSAVCFFHGTVDFHVFFIESAFAAPKTNTCPLKRDHFQKEVGSCNQEFSGDMGYVSFSGDVYHLGGGFKYFLFSSLLGEMIQFDEYFSKGLKQPTRPWFHIRP